MFLRTGEDGQPILAMADQYNDPKLMVDFDKDGTPSFSIKNDDGDIRILLVTLFSLCDFRKKSHVSELQACGPRS